MSARTYGILMRIIAFTLAALIAISIVRELPVYLPVIAVMVALVIASVCRRFVREIIVDERNKRIEEKATATSYRIYTFATAMIVLVALMLRSVLPSWVTVAAQTLAYSLCAFMLVHLACSRYYGRKL